MNITYTAQRSLMAGHVAGTTYTLAIDTTQRALTRSVERIQQKTLSGKFETLYFYGARKWSVTFEPVNGVLSPQLFEFLDSTESGELFSATLNGETMPAVNLKRTDDGYSFAMFMDVGDLARDWHQVTIEATEQ